MVGLHLLGVELPLLVQAWFQLESLQVSWGPRGGGSGGLCLMGCTYGLSLPWDAWLFPLGCASTGGDLQCQAAIPLSPCSSSSSLPLLLHTPSMLLPPFFLSELLMLWGSPRWVGCLYEGAWRALGSFSFIAGGGPRRAAHPEGC